jgi:ATP-binding cassette, subfamily B, bacterial
MNRDVWRLGVRLGRHRPVLFVAGCLIVLGFWSAPLLAGLLLRAVFDSVMGDAPAGLNVASLAVLFLAVEAGRAGLLFGMFRLWAHWWISVATMLRVNLLEPQVVSGGPRAAPNVTDAGAAVTLFRDDVDDFVMWVDTWLDVAATVVFAAVALVVMVRIDPVVTVAVALPLLVVFVLNRVLTPRIRGYRRADREATERVTGFLGELFASVQAVKVTGGEDRAVARLARLNDGRKRTALRDRLLGDSLEAVNSSTVDLSIGLVLLLAAGSMRDGSFTVGDLALFTLYVGWLGALPRWMGFLLKRHRHAQVAAGRMGALQPVEDPAGFVTPRRPDLLARPLAEQLVDAATLRPAQVSVRGLQLQRADGSVGLHGIDLDLPAGSFTVVTGPVGAGKSTLLRALLGLVGPVEGEIVVDGEVVTDPAAFFVPPRSAYVSQVPRLFTDTLRDNLTMGRNTDDDAVTSALRTAVMEDDLADMPDGLETVIGSRGVRLSGGQVQRAAAARALVTSPRLLVVDDLSSALDVATERTLWDGLLREDHPTILAVSHREATLARADQVLTMARGRLIPS